MAKVAQVLGIPKASLGNGVRVERRAQLSGFAGDSKEPKVTADQMDEALTKNVFKAQERCCGSAFLLLGVALHQPMHRLGWRDFPVQQFHHGGSNRHVHAQGLGTGQDGTGAVHALGHMA